MHPGETDATTSPRFGTGATSGRVFDTPIMSSEIRATAHRIVAGAEAGGLTLRLIGGVAIAIRSPAALEPPLARNYEDIDLVARKSDRARLDDVLAKLGWEGDRRFNAMNGTQRRIYHHPDAPKIDVFVGNFKMCHEIEIGEDRLAADDLTVPLAELVLTKAQIVHVNPKDLTDLCALFVDHPVSDHDKDAINAGRIAALCANDWGLWRTVTGTLDHLSTAVHDIGVEHTRADVVAGRLGALREAMDSATKSSRWKLRSRVGERVKWYELPEEPYHGG